VLAEETSFTTWVLRVRDCDGRKEDALFVDLPLLTGGIEEVVSGKLTAKGKFLGLGFGSNS